MRSFAAVLLAGSLLAAVPLHARDQTQSQPVVQPVPTTTADPARPVTDGKVTAVDVVATPVSDLNLRKTDIPALLISAQSDPYALAGLRRCTDIAAEIGHLDAALGDDLDMRTPAGPAMTAGSVAQSVVGVLIPFRGVIREISGANDQDRKMRAAVFAGGTRRGFLKGVGVSRGCPYPSRPASAALVAQRAAQVEATRTARTAARRSGKKVRYTAQPVVQNAH